MKYLIDPLGILTSPVDDSATVGCPRFKDNLACSLEELGIQQLPLGFVDGCSRICAQLDLLLLVLL